MSSRASGDKSLLDAYLPYARTNEHWVMMPPGFKVDPEKREALTLKRRDVLQRWTP